MQKKKKIVLFDIDYTLFNAQQFRSTFFTNLLTQINPQDRKKLLQIFEEVYEETKQKTSFFDPKTFLLLLEKKIQPLQNQPFLEKIIMQEEILESSLYE